MADRSAKVQDRIREELAKNPAATTGELQAAARSIDASVAGLSLRQFNAGYVLPLKRKNAAGSKKPKAAAPVRRKGGRQKQAAAAPKPGGRARRATPAPAPAPVGGDRERARAALLQFAKDFSAAESRPAIVGVLSNLDRYVDQIIGGRD
jgi:hypothetical protein